jgi:hypothetical protein
MECGAVIGVTLQPAGQGDTTTIRETLAEAGETVAHLIGAGSREGAAARPAGT